MDPLRARLDGHLQRLRDRVAAADDEPGAAGRERAPEIGQRLEQEGDAVRRAEAREHGLVEDEERHDARRAVDGVGERGVVVHAEVAREEDDDRAHERPEGRLRCSPPASRPRPPPRETTARACAARSRRAGAPCAR